MSIKNLTGSKDFRHSFSDDMESFFYVVLYAASLWLAHDYVMDLGGLMEDYFNESRFSFGATRGGSRKATNLLYNNFVDQFHWSGGILEWFYAILDLLKVAILDRLDCDPEKFAEIWEANLGKDLPNDDRQMHRMDLPDDVSEEELMFSSDVASSKPEQSENELEEDKGEQSEVGESETVSTGSKRSADVAGPEEDLGNAYKRLRRSVRIAKQVRQA